MIFVLRHDGQLQHLVAADIPSLDRLSPQECRDLARDLAADTRRIVERRDPGETPAAGDLATRGEW